MASSGDSDEPQDDSFSSDEETFQVFFFEILET
jgi:hypothetical protein